MDTRVFSKFVIGVGVAGLITCALLFGIYQPEKMSEVKIAMSQIDGTYRRDHGAEREWREMRTYAIISGAGGAIFLVLGFGLAAANPREKKVYDWEKS